MVHRAEELSPAQRAAAELLLGRPLEDGESITVHTFQQLPISEERRGEVVAKLETFLAEADRNSSSTPQDDFEGIFEEAMRSSRPGYRPKR
jgi:hypothetical protein